MAKRNAKHLSYILFAFVVFVLFFYMLNESKKKEQFANESSTASKIIEYILIGMFGLFITLWIGFAVFGKV